MRKDFTSNKNSYSTGSYNVKPVQSGILNSILVIALIIMILSALISLLNNAVAIDLNFSSLLSILQNAPSIDLSMPIDLTIYGDWSFLNFLKDFLNTLTSIVELSVWLANLVWQTVVYIFYFCFALFGIEIV